MAPDFDYANAADKRRAQNHSPGSYACPGIGLTVRMVNITLTISYHIGFGISNLALFIGMRMARLISLLKSGFTCKPMYLRRQYGRQKLL
ncbi:MAG: hypothetical protein GXZ09_01395 [Syntrophomonadaceae bacterium]|nr:hypothetical protein [Syntrophomonadaceae bacterium]